jgi:hypothetical protein
LGLAVVLVAIWGVGAAVGAPTARASTTQQSVIEDNRALHRNLDGTLETMRDSGATIVKVVVNWDSLAPRATRQRGPTAFDATDPRAYPAASWAFLDAVDEQATADGLTVGFQLTGPAPRWANGSGMPRSGNCPCRQWKPSARAFGLFAQAVGRRFDGTYTPAGDTSALPRVSWWSIWNEPNYGPNLAPQARDDDRIELSPAEYRGLLDAAWRGLVASGHTPATDTILFGETAPRGLTHPIGNFSGMKPLRFLRALYCVNVRYRELRGRAAAVRGCPTTAAGSSSFEARNPALFQASGFADHPYTQGVEPDLPTYACGRTFCVNRRTRRSDPDYADFAELGRLGQTLDRLVSVYGSHVQFPTWNTEFGYWTDPPDKASGSLPPQTAALYMNWAEYLSYRNPRLASYAQYLLVDARNGKFADGLELVSGKHLASFAAFQMPLYMPTANVSSARSLTVWGAVRPAAYSLMPTTADLEFEPRGSGQWQTLEIVPVTNPRGYYELSVPFTASGSVRAAWTDPAGQTEYSRVQPVKVG